jgi:hypothetical protein
MKRVVIKDEAGNIVEPTPIESERFSKSSSLARHKEAIYNSKNMLKYFFDTTKKPRKNIDYNGRLNIYEHMEPSFMVKLTQ